MEVRPLPREAGKPSSVMCKVKLQSLLAQREMLRNYTATQAAQSERITMDRLYIQVSRDEYEELIDLAIEALRNRLREE